MEDLLDFDEVKNKISKIDLLLIKQALEELSQRDIQNGKGATSYVTALKNLFNEEIGKPYKKFDLSNLGKKKTYTLFDLSDEDVYTLLFSLDIANRVMNIKDEYEEGYCRSLFSIDRYNNLHKKIKKLVFIDEK